MIKEQFFEEKELLEALEYFPAVSVILPFEPKMSSRAELDQRLKSASDKVERELLKKYTAENALPVIRKLKNQVSRLDFSTYKRSIALYASAGFEKVYYLDIPVEEKIIIDESFEVRDLVYSKKDIHKYLILVISNERSRMFLGNTVQFMRLSSNTPKQVDISLGVILKAYPLPLFVMGAGRAVSQFKKSSQYANRITGFVPGNFDEAPDEEIRKAIAPLVADWQKVKQEDLLHQLDAAMCAGQLAVGADEAWTAACKRKGRLLVVEKNYVDHAVDDIIEKVLVQGGDVEFADEGMLEDYERMALILYY